MHRNPSAFKLEAKPYISALRETRDKVVNLEKMKKILQQKIVMYKGLVK